MSNASAAPYSNVWLMQVACLLVGAAAVANIAGIFLVGPYAWDDGAITLAYARTLAENGIFALTGVSEVVEGSSSPLFVFVMAALHGLFNFSFLGLIGASQFVTLFFVVATLLLVFHALRTSMASAAERLLLVGLFAVVPVFTTEIHNGMEMSMLAFILTAICIGVRRSSPLLFLLIPAALLTRFECVVYLGFAFGMCMLLQAGERRSMLMLLLYTLLVFGLISIVRWFYFGDLLPNTIHAKLHQPYSASGSLSDKALLKIRGLAEFGRVTLFLLLPALLAAACLFFRSKKVDFGAMLIVAFGLFALASGKNWGYDGRMFLGSLPLFVLVIARGFVSPAFRWHAAVPGCLRSQRPVFLLLCLAFTGTVLINGRLMIFNVNNMLAGGHYQNLLPRGFETQGSAAMVQAALQSNWYGVTPANYRMTGLAVEEIRKIIGQEKIVLMAPDVGGLALCCQRIQIVDSGLLTNRFLAHNGYSALPTYLEKTRPDVIETHGLWSQHSGIYQSAFFRAEYRPIVFNDNFLWLRADWLPRLNAAAGVKVSEVADPRSEKGLRYLPAIGPDVDYMNSMPRLAVPRFTTP